MVNPLLDIVSSMVMCEAVASMISVSNSKPVWAGSEVVEREDRERRNEEIV
jgi:hypothetical protein